MSTVEMKDRRIKVETYVSATFRDAVQGISYKGLVGEFDESIELDMIWPFDNKTQSGKQMVEFALFTPRDIGLKGEGRGKKVGYPLFCREAMEIGFELCKEEDGPCLRLGYLNQPEGEDIVVVAPGIPGYAGMTTLFCVSRNGDKLVLYADQPMLSFKENQLCALRVPKKHRQR